MKKSRKKRNKNRGGDMNVEDITSKLDLLYSRLPRFANNVDVCISIESTVWTQMDLLRRQHSPEANRALIQYMEKFAQYRIEHVYPLPKCEDYQLGLDLSGAD